MYGVFKVGRSTRTSTFIFAVVSVYVILMSQILTQAFPTPRCELVTNWEGWETAPGKVLRCPTPNFVTDQLFLVICSNRNCRNPQTNAKIRGYYSKPIKRTIKLLDRHNNYRDIEISVGCFCKRRV
uniref:uncharacterized protein LOC104266414 n=1 Tax=Ciona intestinalis TaxID=7719 RepID=UPI000521A61D|nr:uncharacterized protein LOC104266414 [Ciona intestinalis]|eukprot:XP_009860849.1 uncharacterized protein LOC104266414 [Ciona intestinalis]